jgi:hypothetical protein
MPRDDAVLVYIGGPFILFMASWFVAFAIAYYLLWLKGGHFVFRSFLIRAVVAWIVLLLASPVILGAWAWIEFAKAVGGGCVNC